jgi:hypothetical protein
MSQLVVVTNKAWGRFGVANAVFGVACHPRNSTFFGSGSRAVGHR